MKKLLMITVALLIGIASNPLYAQKEGNKVVCFKSNMDCANCEKTISEYLKFEKGVKDLKVDHVTNTIRVEYKDGKNSEEALAKAVEKKGYKAEKISREEYEKIVGKAKGAGHEHGQQQHKEQN